MQTYWLARSKRKRLPGGEEHAVRYDKEMGLVATCFNVEKCIAALR